MKLATPKIFYILIFLISSTTTPALAQIITEQDFNIAPADFSVELQNNLSHHQWEKGYLDVTKPPYNAVGDGVTDDTAAINKAVQDGFTYHFNVFFPGDKTYLVSQQIKCVTTHKTRKHGFHLVGSTIGATPVIKLKDGSTVDGDILVYFDLIFKGVSAAPNNYGNQFKGINIDLGNNPTVSGISLDSNQYASIQDMKVYGTNFKAGVRNMPGCGNGMVNITVIGGEYGIWQEKYRPEPTVFGLTLKNQTKYGIYHTNSRGPLIIGGFKIVSPENAASDYRAIYSKNTGSYNTFGITDHAQGNLSLFDGTIEVTGASTTAIHNHQQDVTIHNVYIKADKLIESGEGVGTPNIINGDVSLWSKLDNFIFTSSADKSTVFENATHLNDRSANYQTYDSVASSPTAPSTDFRQVHGWANNLPNWEDSNTVDIVTDFGATPDNYIDANTGTQTGNTDDDTPKIQAAIDAVTTPGNEHYGKTVVVPRGFFKIASPLNFKSGLKIIGTNHLHSVIMPLNEWDNSLGAMIESEDVATGSLHISDLGIVHYQNMGALYIKTPNFFIRNLGTKRARIYNDDSTFPVLNTATDPFYLFSGNAGGKIYNTCLGGASGNGGEAEENPAPTGDYYVLFINNTTNPITFYHLNIAKHKRSPQVMLNNVENFKIYGLKYEKERELMHIKNSDNVLIRGGSGPYLFHNQADEAMIRVITSSNVTLENLSKRQNREQDVYTNWIKEEKNSGNSLINGDYGILSFKSSWKPLLSTTDIETNKRTFGIYPNPVQDYLTINIENYEAFKGALISIHSVLGKQVYQSKVNSKQTYIDTKSWNASGMYFITLNKSNGEIIGNKKIIKK